MNKQRLAEKWNEHKKNKWFLEYTLKQLVLWLLILFISLLLWEGTKAEIESSRVRQKALKVVEVQEEEMLLKIAEEEQLLLNTLQEYVQVVSAKSCVILCFDDFGKTPYQEIIKEMDRYGYTGVLVFRDGKIPGMNGSISVELYQELLDKGWEGAIGNKKDIRVYHHLPKESKQLWLQYMQVMRKGFEDAGLEVPKVYIPHKNEDVSEVLDSLWEMEMTAYTRYEAYAYNTGTPMNTDAIVEMDMTRAEYYYDTLGSDLIRLIPVADSMALWFEKVENGKPNNLDYTSIYMVKKHLEKLYMYSSFLKVTTFSEYQNYQRELVEQNRELWYQCLEEQAEIQRRIDVLEKEIWDMYQEIFAM